MVNAGHDMTNTMGNNNKTERRSEVGRLLEGRKHDAGDHRCSIVLKDWNRIKGRDGRRDDKMQDSGCRIQDIVDGVS